MILIILISPALPSAKAAGDSIHITSNSFSVAADGALLLNAEVKDTSGNVVSSDFTWTASNGSIDSNGLFLPWSAGIVNITATSGSLEKTVQVNVSAAWPSHVKIELENSVFSFERRIPLNATLLDSRGNEVEGRSANWMSSSGQINSDGTFSPDSVGSVTLWAYWNEVVASTVIEIEPSTPVTMVLEQGLSLRSGNEIIITPIIYDAWGNEVAISKAGTLTWSAEKGGFPEAGKYRGSDVGEWRIWVNSSIGLNTSSTIVVTHSDAISLQIEEINQTIYAGEKVQLISLQTDSLGNQAPIDLPLSNWTVDSGGLSLDELGKIWWTPGPMGQWNISLTDGGLSDSISVIVNHGIAEKVQIESPSDSLRAGSGVVLTAVAIDNRGNSWLVNSSWQVLGDQQNGELELHGDWVFFTPLKVGSISIKMTWLDIQSTQIYENETVLEVSAGPLSRITLNQSTQVIASDEELDLNPQFYDRLGNEVSDVILNWTVDGDDATTSLRLSDSFWQPIGIGMHEIQASAAGIHASLMLEVVHGKARHLHSAAVSGIVVVSGSGAVEFKLEASDIHGNRFFPTDITWTIPEGSASLAAGSQGIGYWMVEGELSGEWEILISSDQASIIIPLKVWPGEAARLIAEVDEESVLQGESILLTLSAIDGFGNPADVEVETVEISCTSGKATHLTEGTWELVTENSGKDQACTIISGELMTQQFYDVEEVWLDGMLGSTNTALSMASVILLLIAALFLVILRKNKSDDDFDDKWEDFEDEEEDLTPKLTQTMIDSLARQSKETGVMQATPDTEQGKSGWYVDTDGTLLEFEVTADGQWIKVE